MFDLSHKPTTINQWGNDDLANLVNLLNQLEEKLQNKLNVQPDCYPTIYKQAECKRKLGKIDEAIELYKNLLKHQPDNTLANNTLLALQGRFYPRLIKHCEYNAAPLLIKPNFLSNQQHQTILKYMQEQSENYTPALIESSQKKQYVPSVRNNVDIKGNHPIKAIIREKITDKITEDALLLGFENFRTDFIEVKLRAYRNGEYFRTHQDATENRKITFVYFLFNQPKKFSGGDLILFDSNIKTSCYCDRYTRIIPSNNTLFIFPSHYYHAVLPVKTEDSSLLSTRFAINGHIHQQA